jgi:hypothetical protein
VVELEGEPLFPQLATTKGESAQATRTIRRFMEAADLRKRMPRVYIFSTTHSGKTMHARMAW